MSFDTDLQKFADHMDLNLTLVVKRIAFELFQRIVERTPVDEGIARASWQMTVNRISNRTATAGAAVGSIIEAAKSTIQIKKEDVVYITNSLQYIYYLEHGSSSQAPEGMVSVTLASVQAWIESVIKQEVG